jgi:hypothetical protein
MTRFVYLDEAGISNPEHEPWVVVAGFIVHADDQWRALERYLGDMIEDLVPEDRREGFYFRGYEIWSGDKKGHFPKTEFSGDYRWKILEELVSIPQQWQMQIVMGCVDRRRHIWGHLPTPEDEVIAEQTGCYFQCALQAEKFMREAAKENEVAVLIAERADAAGPIKHLHNWIRNPKEVAAWRGDDDLKLQKEWQKYLPVERIVETVHFADKTDSLPLQLADVCAFIIKRHLSGKQNSEPLYQKLAPCLMFRPRMDLPSDEPKPSAGDEESGPEQSS